MFCKLTLNDNYGASVRFYGNIRYFNGHHFIFHWNIGCKITYFSKKREKRKEVLAGRCPDKN